MKKIKLLLIVVFAVTILISCSTVAQKMTEKTGVGVSGELKTLTIVKKSGGTSVSLSPGESVVLIAKGYDANAREIKSTNISGTSINPEWSVNNMGSVNPRKGKTTIFTLSENASGPWITVEARQKDLKATILIEIEKN